MLLWIVNAFSKQLAMHNAKVQSPHSYFINFKSFLSFYFAYALLSFFLCMPITSIPLSILSFALCFWFILLLLFHFITICPPFFLYALLPFSSINTPNKYCYAIPHYHNIAHTESYITWSWSYGVITSFQFHCMNGPQNEMVIYLHTFH